MGYIDMIGFVAAISTTICLVPQVWTSYRTKSTKDISLVMYSIFCFGVFLWLVYGMLIMSWPLILANTISFFLGLSILVMKIRYG